MKLFEYETKTIIARNGIPTPKGALATYPAQAYEVASQLNAPYAVKAQVLVAGRGKAGGIQFAQTLEEIKDVAAKVLGMNIKDQKVEKILIEEKIKIRNELYFGITVDRSHRCYVAVASSAGGVNIEDVAAKTPDKIIKHFIDPSLGFRSYHAMQMVRKMGYRRESMLKLAVILERLYKTAVEYDAELIEMNPIVETVNDRFVAVDARLIIDENAHYRHRQFEDRLLSEAREHTPEEVKAREAGLAYVKLDGNIGIMGNGAGLVMASLDLVDLYGGKPANFLDVGGGASERQVAEALDILLQDEQATVVFINILGGITRCDDVARGILKANKKAESEKPIIIRLIGTNDEEGRRILSEAGIHVLDSMEEAAKKAVAMVEER